MTDTTDRQAARLALLAMRASVSHSGTVRGDSYIFPPLWSNISLEDAIERLASSIKPVFCALDVVANTLMVTVQPDTGRISNHSMMTQSEPTENTPANARHLWSHSPTVLVRCVGWSETITVNAVAIDRYHDGYRFRGSDTLGMRSVADNGPGIDRELDLARDQGAVGVLSVGAAPDDDPLGDFFVDQPNGTLMGFYESIPSFADPTHRLALQQKYLRFIRACRQTTPWAEPPAFVTDAAAASDDVILVQGRTTAWAKAFRELWQGCPCPPEIEEILAKLPMVNPD
jgi:hypothetical protein